VPRQKDSPTGRLLQRSLKRVRVIETDR